MEKPRKGRPDRKALPRRSGDSPSFRLPQVTNANTLAWPMRLNKFIASSGVCARRAAAELVKEGKIMLNGQVETNPGTLVNQTDKVVYNGKELRPTDRFTYILLNKPKNYLCTSADDRGRHSVLELIRETDRERLFSVGRLDRNTTGLLLLTNDGDLAQRLSHPSNEVGKSYLVELDRNVSEKDMQRIAEGLKLEDGVIQVDGVAWPDVQRRQLVQLDIHSGKNRIVRRIFEHLGYEVEKLDRTTYAGLTKKDLPRGRYRHLTDREIIMLRHFTGRRKGLETPPEK
jgi:23S rRNA pseudouridine2605 synthase